MSDRRQALAALRHLPPAIAALLLTLLLGACATPTPPADPRALLHDEWFAAAPVVAVDPFALSDEMRQYAQQVLPTLSSTRDPRRALIDALYGNGQLRLDYDNSRTRSAAEAFAARAGNCLSLVVMTAAFARHLDLPVSFQSVRVDDAYTRRGDLFLSSGHVNLVLARPEGRRLARGFEDGSLTVDFLPQNDLGRLQTQPLDERTIVAMFLNNRAVESLGEGRIDAAYAWVRQALLKEPTFLAAANTLAVIYSRAGHGEAAEQVLRQLLQREPENVAALSNLVGLLGRGGRAAEAQALAARLAQLQPVPPFHDFDLGRKAMAEGQPRQALEHFLRELRRHPEQEESHFWAAQALWQLGDAERAAGHLRQAMAHSSTPAGQARYAAKLDSLRNGAPR